MRSILLLIITLCVLALGFGVYWVMLGADGVAGGPSESSVARTGAATMPTTNPTLVGPGQNASWDDFDKLGRLRSRLRAERYEPQKEGWVIVYKPQAEFYFYEGQTPALRQVVRVMGETGRVRMEEGVGKTRGLGGNIGSVPRGGDLSGVKILMLSPQEMRRPTLTMTMESVMFDNETFRVQTPNDAVAVKVRGDDYEFDGWGLSLQFNELEQRLEYLQVAKGRRLLIKNPDQFMGTKTEEAAPAVGRATLPLPGIVLAAADNTAVGEAVRSESRRPRRGMAATQPGQRSQTDETVYRATFKQEVLILQGGQKLATAEELQVDFLYEPGESEEPAATQPGQPATRPARRVRTAGEPTSRPARRRAAATMPATSPVGQELEVRWSGPLTIVPILGDRPQRIEAGESIVKLIGSASRPVEVTRTSEGVTSHLRCAALTHWTIDSGVLLEEGHGRRVEVWDSRGTRLSTRSMRFSQTDGTAMLGEGQAALPLEQQNDPAKKDAKAELMEVAWAERCTLHLDGERMDQMVMKQADLQGKVRVSHPEMKLASDTLRLGFGLENEATTRPTTRPERSAPPLRQVDAGGGVQCVTLGPGGAADVRKIECESVRMLTARTSEGKLYARNIVAMGQVHAVDAQRDLRAGYVSVSLAQPTTKPTTRPTVAKGADLAPGELESLIAHDEVRVTTNDGKSAAADQLVIEVKDKEATATLHGRPAVVKDGKNTLSGLIIHMNPERQQLSVTGGGTLEGMSQKTEDGTERPSVVTWKKSMRADGKEDLLECTGGVTAMMVDTEGSVNTVKGERVRLATTRPATRPATQPVVASAQASAATQPTTKPAKDFDVMADRQIRSIVIEEGAQVDSVLNKDGRDMRVFHVESPLIRYDGEEKVLAIPQAGKMLFMDRRAPAAQAAAQEAAKDPMSMRGTTAFSWDKSLVYDEAKHRITMSGNVNMARLEQGQENVEPLRFLAEVVVADLEPSPVSATQPATKPAGMMALSPKMQLKAVTAEGGILITGPQVKGTFEADSMDYDPVKHLLTVRGTERRRAVQRDAREMEVASFLWLIWNTETGQVVDSKELKVTSNGKGMGGVVK